MFRNIFLKTLRDYRRAILIWGGGIALLMASIPPSYDGLFVGPTRNFQIQEFEKLTNSFAFLLGKIYDMDTLGGFVTYRYPLVFAAILAIFGLITGSGLSRGDEERGLLDLLASTPHSRASILLQKWAGLVVILGAIGVLIWSGLMLGSLGSKYSLDGGAAALTILNILLVALFFGTVAFVIGQFQSRKATMGWTGGLLALTWLLNSLGDSVNALGWLRFFSPLYYLSANKPLARSVGANWGALTVLVVAPLPLIALAVWLYQKRDQNDFFYLFRRTKAVPARLTYRMDEPKAWWLANPFNFAVKSSLLLTFLWGVGIAAYVTTIMSVFNDIRDNLISVINSSDLFKNLGRASLTSNEAVISAILFIFLLIVFAAYAVQQITGWTGDENEGRLELLLSAPQPRWKLLLSRFVGAVLTTGLGVGLVGLVYALIIILTNIQVDATRSVGAFVGVWVLCSVVEAAGYLIAAFRSGLAVALVGGLVIVSYLLDLFAPLLKLPDWLVSFSVFHQYGQPLINGLNWNTQFLLLGLSVAFIAVAVWRFHQRDISK